MAELRTAAAQRLAALEAGVGAAVDAAAARFEAVRADLTAHAGRAEADLAALQARLAGGSGRSGMSAHLFRLQSPGVEQF